MLCLSLIVLTTLTIKFASIAPEGSYWYSMAKDVEKTLAKDQNIKLIIYGGTSMGDEYEIVKKIRIGQIHAAGMTSHGLEMISPEIRAYDIPLVFNSYEEFFAVRDRLFPELQKRFEEKGYKLLSHFAIGFIYIFSRKENPWGSNLWVWTGDVLSEAQGKEMRDIFRIIPLQINDVLQALATGMVDSVLNAWYALQALQWSNHVKSYIDIPQFLYTAGILIRKDIWEKIPLETRQQSEKRIFESGINVEKDVIKLNQEVQAKSLGKIKRVNEPKENIEKLKLSMERVKQRLLEENPKVKEFYALIEKELDRIRSSSKTPH